MSLISMTGRGTATATSGAIQADIQVTSINRKQLDVQLNLPKQLLKMEQDLVKDVQKIISRGRIYADIKVNFNQGAAASGSIDEKKAKAFISELRSVGKKCSLADDLGMSALLRMPQLMDNELSKTELKKAENLVRKVFKQALCDLNTMRSAEGEELKKDMLVRFDSLSKITQKIKKAAPKVSKLYRENLKKRIAKAELNLDESDERIIKEIALYADRCDISEELTRIESHLLQIEEFFTKKEAVGRQLDFIAQELFREINTTGTKANSFEISKLVIAFKSELEKIREQVQNVE